MAFTTGNGDDSVHFWVLVYWELRIKNFLHRFEIDWLRFSQIFGKGRKRPLLARLALFTVEIGFDAAGCFLFWSVVLFLGGRGALVV